MLIACVNIQNLINSNLRIQLIIDLQIGADFATTMGGRD